MTGRALIESLVRDGFARRRAAACLVRRDAALAVNADGRRRQLQFTPNGRSRSTRATPSPGTGSAPTSQPRRLRRRPAARRRADPARVCSSRIRASRRAHRGAAARRHLELTRSTTAGHLRTTGAARHPGHDRPASSSTPVERARHAERSARLASWRRPRPCASASATSRSGSGSRRARARIAVVKVTVNGQAGHGQPRGQAVHRTGRPARLRHRDLRGPDRRAPTGDGKTLRGTRRYRTCAAKLASAALPPL